ncbi:MAG: hypothetical protein C0616_01955 [Desulfuromonas sp.]|nr:MAG: hypothetical protein C0616_01955 [Desulfuromonas sp.]
MSRRYIAIELKQELVRVAVAVSGKAGPVLERVASAPRETGQSLSGIVSGLLDEPLRVGDRLVASLPARSGLVRHLTFPFADEKKLAAALELELDAQLPVRLDHHLVTYRQLEKKADNEHRLCAAAVSNDVIRETLNPFDEAGLPVGLLDLAPYGYVDGIRSQMRDGLLGIVHAQEFSLVLLSEGKAVETRFTPLPAGRAVEAVARQVSQQARSLQAARRASDLSFCLIGDGVSEDLLSLLTEQGWNLTSLKLPGLSHSPASAELPVAALALRACRPPKDKGLNFRTGQFALKSEWRRLQRNLAIGAGVFLLATILLATSAWLNYAARSQHAETLRDQAVALFQASFPNERVVVDPQKQLQSKIAALQQQIEQLGADRAFTPLTTLREVSRRTPDDLKSDIRLFSYDADEVRIEGRTDSFDSIDRLSTGLEQSSMFEEVRIADAKLSLDGKQVDFRLTLSRAGQEVQP